MTTTKGDLKKMASEIARDVRNRAILVLSRAGEIAVNEARSTAKEHDWTDRTGNLRSSIGYAIFENGKPIADGGFEKSASTANEGPISGPYYALRIGQTTKGLALVVVAGMNYAIYVADRGYNVLSSSQIIAAKTVKELFEKFEEHDKENG